MPLLINWKICDNVEECTGLEACTTGALSWNDKNKTLEIDNDKCTACGLCETACEVDAIKVANTEDEYKKYKTEIEADPRTIKDLMIDRYGAQPIHPAFQLPKEDFEGTIQSSKTILVVELYSEDSIECMIKSIPIKELIGEIDAEYHKILVEENDEILKKYQVGQLPALLIFNKEILLGKIEGYFDTSKINELQNKLKQIFKN